jgi:putative spermidine/putrescine transport system ATP-binding protein
MPQPANLELVHVTKRYGATVAVDAVDLKVPAGVYCCLLGPSGCGKTSTLRMIAGHESVTVGDILIGPSKARHGDDVPELRSVPASFLHRQRRLLAQDERRR